MEAISGTIAAVMFMAGNIFIGTTLDNPGLPACEQAAYVTVSRPGEGYSFEVSQCELSQHPEYIRQ